MVTQQAIEELTRSSPSLHNVMVERGWVITPDEQKNLATYGLEVLFRNIMERPTSEHMGIFDANMSPAMRTLEAEILQCLNTNRDIRSVIGQRQLRRELKAAGKSNLTELSRFGGELYAKKPRKSGDVMSTGELEFKIVDAKPVAGPHFFGRAVMGYYGFLKYFAEEVALIAPQGANAYLLGAGWVVTVYAGLASSPIGSDSVLKPVTKKFSGLDDLRHVVPVQFFNVEIDKSTKYSVSWEKEGDSHKVKLIAAPA